MTAPVADLALAVKPTDSWWTVVAVDPVAVRMLPLLVRVRRLTPIAVTGAAFAVGLVAIALFATGHFRAAAIGYELRFFLDCLDGKIARVRHLTSTTGAVLDRLADSVTIPAAYAALGWSLASAGAIDSRLALAPALLSALVVVAELTLELTRRAPGASAPIVMRRDTGVLGWMQRHRLTARPWTVEAETVGLFLAPLLLTVAWVGRVELTLVAVYAVFAVVDIALVLLELRREGAQ